MKRIISLTLVLFMIVPLLLVVPMTASAATGADIVAEAEKWRQANSPYGHSDGSGGYGTAVDCSGLVLQVYKKFGYDLVWDAVAQSKVGSYVDKNSLQPGDIACFSYDSGEIGHVGIYIGNDKMIHAPGIGKYVQYGSYISTWTYNDGCKLEYGRRLIDGTHTHGFWIEYEDAHPHREYRKCNCGHTEYTGYTPNGFELKNETEHPHREYKKCYNCDYTEYTGNTVTVSTCNQCNTPPGKPSLLNMKKIYKANTVIDFQWNETENTTHYNLYISKKNSDGEYENYDMTFEAKSGKTLSPEKGEYRAILQSSNGTTGLASSLVNSDFYYFTVVDEFIGGFYGSNLSWTLDFDGKLIVSGVGDMEEISSLSDVPWHSYRNSIKIVEILDGVTSINNTAFWYCKNLIEIKLPDSLKSLPGDSFVECDSLTSVTIPSNVKNIDGNPFSCCNSLTNVIVENDNEYYCSTNGILFNKGKTEIICYPAGKGDVNYQIPNGVREIGIDAFEDSDNLAIITFPVSIKKIGFSAFRDCNNLTTIYYCGTEEQWNTLDVYDYNTPLMTSNKFFNTTIPVTNVFLNSTSAMLTVGESEVLTATVSPSDATNKNIVWSSSNNSVATVSNGVVTAVSAGTAIITAETEDGGYTATCAVTVTAPVEDVKATFTLSDVSGKPGDTVKVKLSLKTDEAINSIAISNINYDASLLSFVGFSDYEHIEDLTVLPPTFDADKMAIVIGLKKAATFDGDICTLNFKIKDGVDEGSANIIATSLVKNSSTVIASYVEPGIVTVRLQLLGDVDGNDTVDIDDAVALFQYSMLPELYPINYVGNVDFDKSGTVDIDDAVLLFQYSMLPDLYPIE